MKKLFLFLIYLAFSNTTFSQTDTGIIEFPTKDGKVNFEEIITIDSCNKDALFQRAKLWIINSFKSEKDVTTTSDKELGEVKGTGLFNIKVKRSGIIPAFNQEVLFTYRISVKDSKYRYSINDFIYLDDHSNKTNIDLDYYYNFYKSGKRLGRKTTIEYLYASKQKIESIITSLKAAMQQTSQNNW